MRAKLKSMVRMAVPPPVWRRLRVLRRRGHIRTYPRRTVQHIYCGFPLRVQLADAVGESWYDRDWEELPEIRLLRRGRLREAARVFDLGAHQGVVALILARIVGEQGRVIALEANRHSHEVAEVNQRLNQADNLELRHAAVSDGSGSLVFDELMGRVDQGGNLLGAAAVPAVTIDQLADEYGPPDVLVIDVEGFECRALRGAQRVLSRLPDAVVEVHVGVGLEAFGGSAEEVLSFFPPADYDLFMAPPGGSFTSFDASAELTASRFFLVALERG
jgi:FkbM family methyltransferase